jgi:glycosyltransferase involved in cell wall biosynthesis
MLDDPLDSLGHGYKVFEYIGAGRPVLVWAPRGGPIVDLVEETGAGEVASNESELEDILTRWIKEFKESGDVSTPRKNDAIEQYSYKNLTARLVSVLEKVTSEYD